MRKRSKIRKAGTKSVNRLTDMDTREVSIVDRAANQRTFLVVKNDSSEVIEESDDSTEKGSKEKGKNKPKMPSVYSKKLGEISEHLTAIRGVVDTAKSGDGELPESLVSALRSTQQMLKSVSGDSQSIGVLQPAQNLGDLTITETAKSTFISLLDETIRRTDSLAKSLEDVTLLDSNQADEIDAISDMIGDTISKNSEGEINKISIYSLSDEDREIVISEIEKSVSTLNDIKLGLQTKIRKGKNTATKQTVLKHVREASNGLVSAIGKAGGVLSPENEENAVSAVSEALTKLSELSDKNSPEANDEIVKTVKSLVEFLGTLQIEKSEVEKSEGNKSIGLIVSVLKAATMYRSGYHNDGPAVVLTTEDQFISSHDSWLAAENEALRLNITAVLSMATEKNGTEDSTESDSEVKTEKAGRAMSQARIEKLKAVVALLKDAFNDLKSGVADMEKFKKVGDDLSEIIHEVKTAKAALLSRGMTDERGLTADAPNQGSGIQPDLEAVAGIEAIGGDGTIGFEDVLKSHKAEIAKRDQQILAQKAELAALRKRRSAPSAGGDDFVQPVQKSETIGWPRDMAEWSKD